MKFAVVVLACVLATASAQFNRANAFASFGNFPQQNQYNQKYNAPQKYKTPQQDNTPLAYKPAHAVVVATEAVAPVVPVVAVPVATRNSYASGDASADILKYENEIYPDGRFSYNYETNNGISAQAQGIPQDFGGNPPVIADAIQGSYAWKSPEGKDFSITYVADENGYHPQGAAIPTPPPVPPQIARALEYIYARTARN